MKTLLVALNTKFIHSSLAPWYLKNTCDEGCGEIVIYEKTINDNLDSVLGEIYSLKPDVAGFSCYIWNIGQMLYLAENLKKLLPMTKIVFGGPEVSFDAEDLLKANDNIDYIITGEGEYSLKSLLMLLLDENLGTEEKTNRDTYIESYTDTKGESEFATEIKVGEEHQALRKINGLVYRSEEGIIINNPCSQIKALELIPSPYSEEMLADTSGKIVYFESSRGCPFSCSYCLSSIFHGVRYLPLDRTKKELLKLINNGVSLIKFVDRTFNSNKAYAKEVFKFVIQNGGNTVFHFEAAADLFDEEMLSILSNAPSGLIQLEIGIQSTNVKALNEVDRTSNLIKAFNSIRSLTKKNNIHLHLDLIAGLPFEDFDSFGESFNQVYNLKPHNLQLGFLKLLKGSKIRNESEKHEYLFRNLPPYEVLSNRYISFDKILVLKGVEKIFDLYYNSGRFVKILDYIIDKYYINPFSFYLEFNYYCEEKGLLKLPVSSRQLYTILLSYLETIVNTNVTNTNVPSTNFVRDEVALINDLLKFDFLVTDRSNNLPEGIDRNFSPKLKDASFEFLKKEDNIEKHLPGFAGQSTKQIYKSIHFEKFSFDILNTEEGKFFTQKDTTIVFDYSHKNRVTGQFGFCKVEI